MKVLLEKIQVAVDAHGLVDFYFGDPHPDSENFDVKKMKKAEAELLAENGLDKNVPADNFIQILQDQTQGYYDLKSLFTQAIFSRTGINPDIAANLIKTSSKVLNLLKIYSSSGFVTYDTGKKQIFIQKDPTRRRSTNLELSGLNREVFF